MKLNLLSLIAATMILTSTFSLQLKLTTDDLYCAAEDAVWMQTTDPDPTYTLENACTEIPTDEDETWDCDCIQANLIDWDGQRCGDRFQRDCAPDMYFNSTEYQAQTHDVKMGELWEQLTGTPRNVANLTFTKSPTKVKCQNFDEFYKHLNQAPGISMEHTGDEMPNFKFDIRQKLVHQQGIVGKARYIVEDGIIDTYGYTGIFASGAEDVLVRFSETGLHVDDITGAVNPSVAFKFLRSDQPSANQFGMVSFEGKESDDVEPWNWWVDLFTHLPQFKEYENAPTCLKEDSDHIWLDKSEIHTGQCGPMTGGRWLGNAAFRIFSNGQLDLAEYDESGNAPLDGPVFPWSLRFEPNSDLTKTDANSRFYDQLIEGGSAEIPLNTKLYDVYAKNSALEDALEIKIGRIETKDEYFTQSLWGDERLFFKHSTVNHDISAMGETAFADNQLEQTVPTFDFDLYGAWDNPSEFTIPEASGHDVIKGMKNHGCPFAFVIDYINDLGALNPDLARKEEVFEFE